MDILFWVILISIAFLGLLLFFPTKRKTGNVQSKYGNRFHEGDAVLSRRKYEPGSSVYEKYYNTHPDFKDVDDKARSNPGLLSEQSKYYDPVTYGAAEANFILTDNLHSLEDFPVSKTKESVDAKKMSLFLKNWMLKTGAHSVGYTRLEDHHLYSHKGRGKRAGEVIDNNLPHAIAITVEMDKDLMKYAPASPTVMESAEQYLRSGVLATKLGVFIKGLGYNATVHIDGNYEVICPLVAADAGLGVIGRMGLLMTPRLGPRVRIAVVSTDLPLVYHAAKTDITTLDFCKHCKKCASVCPVQAIPLGPRAIVDGNYRWKINSEKCYNYWTVSGTDCGKCVISCPFSHPDNWFHGFIRWGIKNNLVFRRMAVKLDDIFYGRKPSIKRLPDRFTFTR
jgi:reductive dehalogenase